MKLKTLISIYLLTFWPDVYSDVLTLREFGAWNHFSKNNTAERAHAHVCACFNNYIGTLIVPQSGSQLE